MRSIIKVIEDTPLGKEWSDEMRKLYGGNYVNILARGIEGFMTKLLRESFKINTQDAKN